jgi:hypothetical protein
VHDDFFFNFFFQSTSNDLSLMSDLVSLQSTAPFLIVGRTGLVCVCWFEIKNIVVDDNSIDGWYDRRAEAHQLLQQNDSATKLQDSLQWINVQAVLLDICIAFHPLDLPPYVVLEIVDKFPGWSTLINHKKKIDYIIQIKRFCDAMVVRRAD